MAALTDPVHNKRDFDKSASEWDSKSRRRDLAIAVADAIVDRLPLHPAIRALDFGAGTGLLTLRIHPHIQSIQALDTSSGMLDELKKKLDTIGIRNVETTLWDIVEKQRLPGRFDLIVSSMTLHHIPDTAKTVRIFYESLEENGWIGLADLDREEGDFHDDNTGIHHFGFDRDVLVSLFTYAGFKSVQIENVHVIKKTRESSGEKQYPVFLLTAQK